MEVRGRVRPTSRGEGVGIGEKRSVELPVVLQSRCNQVLSGSQRTSPTPTHRSIVRLGRWRTESPWACFLGTSDRDLTPRSL